MTTSFSGVKRSPAQSARARARDSNHWESLYSLGIFPFVGVTLRQTRREPQPVRDQPGSHSTAPTMNPTLAAALVALGLALLVGGGHLLAAYASYTVYLVDS